MRRKSIALQFLVLIALLAFAGSAQALSVPAVPGFPDVLAAPEGEEEAWEAEASEEEELETEECEEEEEAGECDEEASAAAPPECLLSSAEATVFAGNRNRVRLQVRYAATTPTAVTIAYGLHGSKGALFLGTVKKHFGRKGVLRVNRSLNEAQMAKVMAARDFTVRIRVAKAPGWCQSLFDRHLTLRRATPSGVSWQRRG